MPRNMSFMLTTAQVRERTKTVTRRLGWKFLKPGDVLNACEKCQGLKKGEKVEKICQIKVLNVRREELRDITNAEVILEGFKEWDRRGFICMFCEANSCSWNEMITRIEFEYLDDYKGRTLLQDYNLMCKVLKPE